MKILRSKVNETVNTTVDATIDRTTTRMTDRVKLHFRTNKKVYLGVGGGLALGLLANWRRDGASVNKTVQLGYKSQQINQTYQLPQVSNLAKPVLDTTTGTPYLSQNRAASALEVSKSQVSQHLNGKLPDVKGHVLEYIPSE